MQQVKMLTAIDYMSEIWAKEKKQAGVMTQSKSTIYFFKKSYKYQALGKRTSSMAKIFRVTRA